MPGHREGDLIKGAGDKSSVGVLVERSSRSVLLARMESATAQAALAAFTVKLDSIAARCTGAWRPSVSPGILRDLGGPWPTPEARRAPRSRRLS
jgi:hypothetical protein